MMCVCVCDMWGTVGGIVRMMCVSCVGEVWWNSEMIYLCYVGESLLEF